MPHKGYKQTDKHKEKISIGLTGKKLTKEHKKNISIGNKGGNKTSFKKRLPPPKHKDGCKCFRCDKKFGLKHHKWQPDWDKLNIEPKHRRMELVISKTDYCWICKKKTKDLVLSNKDHKYRNCLEDWQWICRKCHKKWDHNYQKIAKL